MRTMLVLAILLSAPIVVAEAETPQDSEERARFEGGQDLELGPDPPPGRPCRPHCFAG